MKFKQHRAMCSICASNGNNGGSGGGSSIAVAKDDGKGNITVSGVRITDTNGNVNIGG